MVCASWLVAAVGLFYAAPAWDTKAQDDDIRFLPDRCASVRGYHLLEKAFPQDVFASKAVFVIELPGEGCVGVLGVRYLYFLNMPDWAYTESVQATFAKWGHDEWLRFVHQVRSEHG